MSNDNEGTFELILLEGSRFLKPLADACKGGTAGVGTLVAEIGLNLDSMLKPEAVADLEQIANEIQIVYSILEPIAENGSVDSSKITDLISQLSKTIDAVHSLSTLQMQPDVPAAFQSLGQLLLDYLLIKYLKSYHQAIYCALLLVGAIDPGGRNDQVFPKIVYSRIPKLITDISGTARDVYGWGTSQFDAATFLSRLHGLLWYLGIPAQFAATNAATALADVAENSRLPLPQLRLPILMLNRSGVISELGLSLLPLKESAAGLPGLGLVPFGVLSLLEEIDAGDSWYVQIATSVDALVPWGVSFRPEGLSVGSVGSSVPPPTANLRILVEHRALPTDHTVLLGSTTGSRLELGSIGLEIGFEIADSPNILVELPIKNLRLIVSAGENDGFLSAILPKDGIKSEFDLTFGYSWKRGVYFAGSGGLEIAIPSHISLGPIDLEGLTLSLKLSGSDLVFAGGANVRAALGPLKAVIQEIGLAATAKFLDNGGGNIGPLDLSLGFKPPNGVGLSIDTGVVKGGGFLRFNYDKGEYFGALELSIQNTINLKAIGIINTKMPDGSPGFALLILITAEFTPIQLGMGFSLMGVGGLLGLNHSTNIDALKSGVRTGAVSSILFPENVIANITRIISDMTTIFPIVESHFIVAPMGKIGWFTPPLITLELGIILDIPSPTLVIIGVLRCVLPEEKAPILKLQVNFAGGIDFNKGIIWFDASLFDSSILVYTLTGDMALRIGWGDNPLFILSVGGFHPAFHEVPPDLTSMTRLTISLLSGNNPRLVAQSYFAVTSNTVQSGAKVELYAEACGFKVYGFLGYDLLVQFNPLYFIADIYAGLALRSGSSEIAGINVHCELSGPTPWHALGDASLKILFFKVSVGFDQTWGESAPPQILEPEDVLKLLVDALNDSRNWKTDIPANTNLSVSVKQIELAPGEIILHPFGVLAVSQKVVPLQLTINKFGNKQPKAETVFDITYSGGNTAYVEEQFAAAQFLQLSDAEKLSRKSFENMKSGLRFQGSDATDHGFEADLDVVYDLIYVHKKKFLTIKAGIFRLFNSVFQVATKGNAAAKSSYSVSRKKASNAPAKVDVRREGYKVVNVSDMEECEGSVAVVTEAEAYEMHDTLIAKNPALRGNIQVVSTSELN